MKKVLDFRVISIRAARNTKDEIIMVDMGLRVEFAVDASGIKPDDTEGHYSYVSEDGIQGVGTLKSFSAQADEWLNANQGARDQMKEQLLDIATDYEAMIERVVSSLNPKHNIAVAPRHSKITTMPDHIEVMFSDDNPTKYSVMEEVSHTVQSTRTTAIATGADA